MPLGMGRGDDPPFQEADGNEASLVVVETVILERDRVSREEGFDADEVDTMLLEVLRVENLDALLAQLALEGVEIDLKREAYEYGKFAWIVDPEGNRIELWEPPPGG